MKLEDLPNDIEALKILVLKQDLQINQLQDTILILQRKKFAPSSEKDSSPQLQLFNEAEDFAIDTGVQEESDEEIEINYKRKRGKRSVISDDLPRVDDIIDLPEEEKAGLKYIGDEISEKLEITPAKIFVRRIVRRKYAREDGSMVKATNSSELLPKCLASSSLIAYIATAKYCDSLPLYRQEKIFTRLSGVLTRQSMSRWLIQVSEKLIPLYNLLQEKLLSRDYLQMDETTTQVLNEDGKKATNKSYMWVRYGPGDQPIILFDYSPTRAGSVPVELLHGFKGYLQTDGYDGYSRVCSENGLVRVGCWDHARRKFFDAAKTSSGKNIGKRAIDQLKRLYKIEEDIKDLPSEKKKLIRQQKSKALLEEFKNWVDETRSKITPDSVAGKAINYSYNEWKYLTEYLNDGRINISNCQVENAIRPFCIGKKNWLFSATVDGANASAMYYSLIETAKRNDLEPFDYLSRMLEKLPLAQTIEDYERLLPLKGQFLA